MLASQTFFALGMFYSALKVVQDNKSCQSRTAGQIQHMIQSNATERNVHNALRSWFWDDVDKELLTQDLVLSGGESLNSHLPEQGVNVQRLYQLLQFEHSILVQVCSSLPIWHPRGMMQLLRSIESTLQLQQNSSLVGPFKDSESRWEC
jgi:hypothetical protein